MPGVFPSSIAAVLRALPIALLGVVVLPSEGVRAAPNGAEPPPSENIAITRLPFAGIAGEVANDLSQLIRETLRNSGFTVLPATVVENRLANDERLAACSTPSCYGRLSQVLGVRRVVEGEVQRLELSTFAIKIGLRDLFTGKFVAPQIVQRCEVCSSDDVRKMVMRASEMMAASAPPVGPQETDRGSASGTLALETDPPGALITVDKVRYAERTPASLLLGAGVHAVQVEGPGYKPLRRPVEILPGQPSSLYLVLTPLPQRRPWLTALSWTSAIAAVGLAVTGGVLLHYHNKPITSPDCPDQPGVMFRCPFKYDALGAGVTALVGAGVLAVGAGIGFYYDNAAPSRRPIGSR